MKDKIIDSGLEIRKKKLAQKRHILNIYSIGDDFPYQLKKKIHEKSLTGVSEFKKLDQEVVYKLPDVKITWYNQKIGQLTSNVIPKSIANRNQFDNLRVVISNNHDNNIKSETFDFKNISHLILINLSKSEEFIDINDLKYSLSVNLNDNERISCLIEDIMFDISMFYSLPKLNEFYDNVERRKDFSNLKKEFILKQKVDCTYGKLNDYISYFPIASICRNNDLTLDFKKYLKLWYEFIGELLDCDVKQDIIIPLIRNEKKLFEDQIKDFDRRGLSIEEQLEYYKYKTNLPHKFKKKILKLPKGDYIITRTKGANKINKKAKRRIMTIYRKRKFKSQIFDIKKIGSYKEIIGKDEAFHSFFWLGVY
ncbi:MAG: hypothetical protein FH753_08365 [Firmicutes bacterium]|nr:hypothetical protein [Bacillota bacterium]